MRASFEEFLRDYGRAAPPASVWEEQFDFDAAALKRLAGPRTQPARPEDLRSYVDDLNYVQRLQPDLLRYVFPDLLWIWHEDLRTREYGGIVEQFWKAISYKAREDAESSVTCGGVLPLLTDKQRAAAARFMRYAILDELDAFRGLHFAGRAAAMNLYAALASVVSYSTAFPEISLLWEAWWRVETPGFACSALCTASSLMYPDGANPIFEPWTPDRGGGPLSLWESASFDSWSELWLPENVAFLQRTLTVDYVRGKVHQAAEALRDEPEGAAAASMAAGFDAGEDLVAARIPELIRLLSTPGANGQIGWTV